MLRFRLLSLKIISGDLLRLRVRLYDFLDQSSTLVSSSNLVSTFIDAMMRYVLWAYLHSKFPGLTAVNRWSLRHSWLDQCKSPELFQHESASKSVKTLC